MKKKRASKKDRAIVKYTKAEREKFLFRTAEEMKAINDAIEKRFNNGTSREDSN